MLVVRNQWQLLQHIRPRGPTGRLVCKANMNANEFAVALAAGAFAGLAFGTWRQRGLCTTSKGLPPPVPPDIFRLVLTGGPCSGKSSSFKYMRPKLEAIGWKVHFVPEVPTILMLGGCKYPGLNAGNKLLCFEKAIIDLQMQMEKSFIDVAVSEGGAHVIISDRGCMDISAYLPAADWKKVLSYCSLTEEVLLNRYDGVIHLVTAADGAEQYYKHGVTKDDLGNAVYREETAEQARELCQKVRKSWQEHKKIAIVPNRGTLETKLEDACEHLINWLNTHRKPCRP